MIQDRHGREVDYLRLAVTDRCNLRCFYCMPEEGIDFLKRQDLLSYEEMLRLCRLLISQGIRKIRITGGEPFLRKDLISFLKEMSRLPGLEEWHLTTNGTLDTSIISELKYLGVASVNLSLDTLDRKKFEEITRRDLLPKVLDTLDTLLEQGIKTKINTVVMARHNIADIIPLVELGRDKPIDVRFIEEMPFNGSGRVEELPWNYASIYKHIEKQHPNIKKLVDPKSSTSMNYHIPGFKGIVGIIAAYSRTFCGTCNRIRLTPKGVLKTCLYDKGTFNIKDLMRAGASDVQILTALEEAVMLKAVDGKAAESKRNQDITESMASIGG